MGRQTQSLTVFVIGLLLFLVGAWLVQDLIIKFLKFAIGIFLIFISLPMMLGSIGWMKFRRVLRR
ncbi:hypothetical protein HQ545_04630 [Candidatus Woesearchaeota archaeon]|nr:hypothetical protein [Candidatus Woesearchaeota archaeon]